MALTWLASGLAEKVVGLNTLTYLAAKYNIDLNQPSPISLAIGRFKDLPRTFAELGFSKGAEIGVYEGAYSKMLLEQIPNLELLCVDLWEAYPGYKDFPANDIAEARSKAERLLARYNAKVVQDWSHEAVKAVPDASLDFVFIDGNHAYEYVVWDIAQWSRKVRPGGIVYGHDFDDYSRSKRWREMHVLEAVTGLFNAYRIAPWFVITNNRNRCWMYVR